jgi:hypothetical protein
MTHPDTDVLAEFRAGLITGRRGAHVAGHLADCERCAALSDQLAEVSALLAAVPVPAMPPSVAHRLDTALAAEVTKNNYPERAGVHARPEPPTRRRPAGNRGFRLVALRVLAPATAVLALAATGYGLSRLGGGPSGQTSSGSAAAPAASITGVRAAPFSARQGVSPERIPQAGFAVVSSSTDYMPATLGTQLKAELRRSPAPATVKPASAAITGCVRRLAGEARPLLLENARFLGRPAIVIVVSRSPGEVAWVAAPGCSATSSRVLDEAKLPPGI